MVTLAEVSSDCSRDFTSSLLRVFFQFLQAVDFYQAVDFCQAAKLLCLF